MKNNVTVGFGEIMLRLSPPGVLRFRQAMPGPVISSFAGAEANVCVGMASMGGNARYVTALPDNDIGRACVAALRGHGVDVSHIHMTSEGRLGIFMVEKGANQRPSRVVYDRAGSSVAITAPEAYNWNDIFKEATWLHISGITPALSEIAANAVLDAARQANERGITVSCDLNFRKKLWKWRSGADPRSLAREVMAGILPYVHMVVGNEEDADDVLGIQAEGTDVEGGRLAIDRYPRVAGRIVERFPNVKHVAITLRESVSAFHNNWGAMLYVADGGHSHFAPLDADGRYEPYAIRHIVDRVGGGDSFASALIYALQDEELSAPTDAIRYAVAASCLAHSLDGDFNLHRRDEVLALMKGSATGRVVR